MPADSLSGVADTLFIPLAARIAVSERFPEYFYDRKAMSLRHLEQVKDIRRKSSEYAVMASVSRYYNVDRMTRAFAAGHRGANIINLGAGLETIRDRLEDVDARFYSVDFPDVIAVRREILGEAENETLIGCDITDMRWSDSVERDKPTLFLLSGVLQYFEPQAVSELIRKLRSRFKEAELIFDATNETGLRYANHFVKKTGNKNALMHFYVNDPEAFARENGVELMEVRGFFGDARKQLGPRLKLYTRIAMKVADEKKRTLLIRIKW